MTSGIVSLEVTSHVGRDLLQSADLFQQVPNVIWEYVSNGLQYVDPGVRPLVRVTAPSRPKRIVIEDNGRGMLFSDLRRFFTMHGENIDRQQGRPGRGTFGTGKSAAFAIASTLRITTVRDGRRSIVELRRADVLAATSGAPVPVHHIEIETRVRAPNGTTVEIEDLKKVRVDLEDIVRTLERHIRHWRGACVEVNGQPVEYSPPPIARTVTKTADDPLLRGAQLTLHVAKAPLADHDRGVAVLASGVLHDTTLGGSEGKLFANYIFGEIDVPALAEPHEGISAFDMSRSRRLNAENKIVLATYALIGRHVEALRRELVEEDRRRRAEAEAALLQCQADEIAKLINEDYSTFRRRFAGQSVKLGAEDRAPSQVLAPEGETQFVNGGDQPAQTIAEQGSLPINEAGDGGGGGGGGITRSGPTVEPANSPDAEEAGREEATVAGKKRRAGGFDVQYRNNGTDNQRASYDHDSRTIFINLDHPQISTARGGGSSDEPNFRRLSFEVAFTEYAVGFAQEMALAGFYQDYHDALYEVRERIDSLSRKAATQVVA